MEAEQPLVGAGKDPVEIVEDATKLVGLGIPNAQERKGIEVAHEESKPARLQTIEDQSQRHSGHDAEAREHNGLRRREAGP